MDKDKLKEAIKESVIVNLRSVILSSKGGVPLNRLQNDYRQLVGTNIPLSELGYSSLENFLQSISQVARFRRNPDGQVFVEAVANSSTVHLQKLISKQKGAGVSKYSAKSYGTKPSPNQKFNPSISSKEKEQLLAKDKIIQDLTGKLRSEKIMNDKLSSEIERLNNSVQSYQHALRTAQGENTSLRNKIEAQASNQTQNDNGIGTLTELLGKLYESNLQKTSDSCSSKSKDSCTHCELYGMYEKHCTEMEQLKTLVQMQNTKMQKMENKFNQQSQIFENYAKRFSSAVNVVGLNQTFTQQNTEILQTRPYNVVAQNAVANSVENGTVESEWLRNSAASSTRSLSSPAVSQISEPPKMTDTQKKKKRKKNKASVKTENK